MRGARRAVVLAACGAGLACERTAIVEESRSAGLPIASLSAAQQVEVYRAAINTAFDVGPGLVLLLHTTSLPAGAGFDGGARLPDSLSLALRGAELVGGTCTPARTSDLRAPTCGAPQSGYVLRGSDIFQRGGDTLQFNLHAEVFAAANGAGTSPFAFEMAYRLAPREGGPGYRVVAEGRVRQVGGARS